jgi:alanyl-tRNA synthetase
MFTLTAQELRDKYSQFFSSKGHTIIPTASLIPANDPTVLFTTAGMHPLVPYLMGEPHPGGKRLASIQKCIRTGDIDEVGDDTHLTFFEMLGNWSLGDYFKKEAIGWSWEFLTDPGWLGVDPARLAFSCFGGDVDAPKDMESARLWMSYGVPEARIAFLTKEDNWWGPAGRTGPCGPDTEMFYWVGDGSPPANFRDTHIDKRWVEIWNDVFLQYNKNAEGRFERLAHQHVDTGMGMERMLMVLAGKKSVFETDLFQPLLDVLRAGVPEAPSKKLRIIADHLKASTFIITDGVNPSNKDAGYVVRRLLRRSMLHARTLFGSSEKLYAAVETVIAQFATAYPELIRERARVLGVIREEDTKFGKTLETGLREFRKILNRNRRITGVDAFNLFQTYGFPMELTHEMVIELSPDFAEQIGDDVIAGQTAKEMREEFEAEFEKHKDRSRDTSAGLFKSGLADRSEIVVRYHTATHLLNAALRKVLGEHVWQKGSNITADRTRFDFSHPQKLTDDEKTEVERLVNDWIVRDLCVEREVMPLEEARKLGAIGAFGEKYSETVSIYTVFDPETKEIVSCEFCGGPHITHTGEIGRFTIVKEEASSAGVRRIKAVIG